MDRAELSLGLSRMYRPTRRMPSLAMTGNVYARTGSDRTERLLRLARLRGDRLAVATLETQLRWRIGEWTESELRAVWGDR